VRAALRMGCSRSRSPTAPRSSCETSKVSQHADAAEIAGVGEAAFKSRLHQGRLKIRAALGDQAFIAVAS